MFVNELVEDTPSPRTSTISPRVYALPRPARRYHRTHPYPLHWGAARLRRGASRDKAASADADAAAATASDRTRCCCHLSSVLWVSRV